MIELFLEYYQRFLEGTFTTIFLAVIGTLGGFVLSLVIVALSTQTVDKKRDNLIMVGLKRVGKAISTGYVVIFRGTPMIVQALIIFYGVAKYTNFDWWNAIVASIIVVTLNTTAYIAEILRGSVNAIDKGQMEAARSLGFSRTSSLLNFVYPQAIKNSLPAIGNEFIVNLKDTAVLSVIGVLDLFNATKQVQGKTYDTVTPYIIAAIIYLVLTGITTILVNHLEKRQKKAVENNA